jgi:hypothetical protein
VGSLKSKSGLRWWLWLLLVNLLVQLQMVERLKNYLHQLILCGYQLLHLWVVVAIVGMVVARLAVALTITHVHHLRYFLYIKGISFLGSDRNPNYML